MSFNTFGKLFRFTTWGESHGPAIGCVVDGCPPNIAISEKDIQIELNKRRPGQSKFVTQRKEKDQVQILSGVFHRPGHADFTYFMKYGNRDFRGGGRQSARETASRVAAGAIAKVVLKKLLGKKFSIIGGVTQIGPLMIDSNLWNDNEIRKNPFFCPDKETVPVWEQYLLDIRKAGSSCGAIIELRARGVPVGLGAPIYSKLDQDIAAGLMSINAVKGVNIGAGMSAASLTGETNSDEIRAKGGKAKFLSNNAGGILGGISTGQEVIASFAVKPTSSILNTRDTIDTKGKNTKISVRGRHDPCVGIRAVPIGEAMLACILLDHLMMHRAQCGN